MKRTGLLSALLFTAGILPAQVLSYRSGNNNWNADSLGDQRAVVQFTGTGPVAKVIIPWRRADHEPQNKRIIVQDGQSRQLVQNVKTGNINEESGELYFEPVSGKGIYYIYYMPAKNEGRSNYPKGVYLAPLNTASEKWLGTVPSAIKPNTTVQAIESIDAFNSFYPMLVCATAKETAELLARNKGRDYLVFPEDRQYPIKMRDRLPYRWIQQGPQSVFKGKADRGEYFAWQLGIYALVPLDDLAIQFTDLKNSQGAMINKTNISCINNTGTDYTGAPMTRQVNVPQNNVQAMWCGVDIPPTAAAGVYTGKAIITASGKQSTSIVIQLTVSNTLLSDGGGSEPWKQTRLKWLNSTMAQENTVIAPYSPLQIQNNTISLLGRKVELNEDGFPKQIQTYFTPAMTAIGDQANNLVTEPVHFHFVRLSDGKNMPWKTKGLQFTQKEAGTVQWKAASGNDTLQMDVEARLEFDGFLAYTVKLTALHDVDLKDITMHIPFRKEMAKYMMGLGQKGGYRPENVDWKWDVAHKNQDGAWIGAVNGGLQFSLRDEKYVRPLNTNFYLQKPLLLPASWGNDNKGGITVGMKGNSMLVNNYTGERHLKKGDQLYFNFNLLITPFHPIDTDAQWATRFYHRYQSIDSIKATGATVINIHHATPINPWINYPFIEHKKMKAYIDEAHSKGLKVKIYNTVRELSNKAWETFPMRSLGHEIYSPGKGGGFRWLQEHIGYDYIAAWFVPEIKDAAIINSGMSRWHNYYVEGMNWLVQNVGIDGIYLDDVAFDRITMKRIKRVLTNNGHPGIIDLHSANQYNKSDGFNNSANLYMEHFPYLNRLWFGEYFDYEKNGPDFFLTEVSGIPFGLMGEMLENGGNPWRGMVYGMTNRMPWSENADPRPIWKAWDDFGMKGSEMIGYWTEASPVTSNNVDVPVTVYMKKGSAMIALASWAPENTMVQLKIDWNKLGIDPSKARITAPDIRNFQQGRSFDIDEAIPVEKNKGWLLILQ